MWNILDFAFEISYLCIRIRRCPAIRVCALSGWREHLIEHLLRQSCGFLRTARAEASGSAGLLLADPAGPYNFAVNSQPQESRLRSNPRGRPKGAGRARTSAAKIPSDI